MVPSLIETVRPSQDTETLLSASKLAGSLCCATEVNGVPATVEEMKNARNPSLQVTADHKLKMVDAPVLKPGKGEVLLHIKVTGICGYEYTFNTCANLSFIDRSIGLIYTSGEQVQLEA